MEMLTGKDLGDELRQRGPLPVADAVDCILQALVGVAEIHALGIVHRDLKPSNLFIATVAGTTIVKVLDFGISKEKKSESLVPLTSTDHVLGTPQYMSPEQVRASKDVDIRSDVWSLGVILYELVTRSLPFQSEGGGVGEMFGKILYVDPDPPSMHRKDLPEGLEAVILKCITREPDKRFANVGELAEALRPFAGPSSLHRIDAVRQASVADAPEVDDDPILEVGESAESSRRDGARGDALTEQSSPDAKRAQLMLAPTALAGKAEQTGDQASKPGLAERGPELALARSDPGAPAPVTAMTSSSIVSSHERERVAKRGGSGKRIAFVALGVVAAAGAIGVFVASRGGSPTTTTAASGSAVSPAEPPTMSAAGNASEASTALLTPLPLLPAGTVVAPPPPSAPASAPGASTSATSAKPHTPFTTVATGRPVVRPTASAAAAGTPPSSAAPKTSAPVLILDRK